VKVQLIDEIGLVAHRNEGATNADDVARAVQGWIV
jgi:hypothetical protein